MKRERQYRRSERVRPDATVSVSVRHPRHLVEAKPLVALGADPPSAVSSFAICLIAVAVTLDADLPRGRLRLDVLKHLPDALGLVVIHEVDFGHMAVMRCYSDAEQGLSIMAKYSSLFIQVTCDSCGKKCRQSSVNSSWNAAHSLVSINRQ